MIEEFRDVIGYEDRYAISNFGRLKAKSYLKRGNRNNYFTKEIIITPTINKHGYIFYKFCINRKCKTYKIHQLVAMMFLNHNTCGHEIYVDHIDRNKLNNNVLNLRLVTPKESVLNRNIVKSSNYPGVSFDTSRKKWVARQIIDKKYKFLGRFSSEIEAYNIILKSDEK